MKNQVTLYIAKHNTTGLKYFGKTTRYFTKEELQKNYHGSGIEWGEHLQEFGDDVAMEIYGVYNLDEVERKALQFSFLNNITESDLWANMKPENGLDGGITKEAIKKMIETINSPEWKNTIGKEAIIKRSKTISSPEWKNTIGKEGNRKMVETRIENKSYITGARKMVETKRIKDKDGLDIYDKTAIKTAETMKKNNIYEITAKKISDTRKERGVAKGMKNNKAKIIGIYNEKDELEFTCYGNFIDICKVNDLPTGPLKQSRLKNTKGIYMKQRPQLEKYKKYTGWYSREIKEVK